MTELADLETAKDLPSGTWVARLETDGRASRLRGQNASERGDLARASYLSLRCLFAGRLHNHVELARQLDMDRGRGEAAALVRAYARWGEGLLDRIEGIFAFVIWNQDSETLLAARDPMGLYPLFFSQSERALLLSNSIEALVRQPDVSAAVNLPALVDHLRHCWPDAEETYFAQVRRVPPGHALRRDHGGIRSWRYWDPSPDGTIDWVSEDELAQFDPLLEQAVERCQEFGRAGIFLSGGLDSVSVAAVAVSSARRDSLPDPWALSLAFPDPDANEEPIQRGVASALGLQQVMLDWDTAVGPGGLMERALELTAASSAPLLNLWMPAYDRLALMGKEGGCQVVLTGAGGDEWLTVSPFYAADLMRRLDLRGLFHLYGDHSRSHNVSHRMYLRNILWRFGARPVFASSVKRQLDWMAPSMLERARLGKFARSASAWLAPDPALRAEMTRRELAMMRSEATRRGSHSNSVRAFPRFYVEQMRSGLDHPLVSMELEESFHQGCRLGMRILQPYWDAQLVAFLYRTPPELLNRGGRSKGLVRDAVARRFPGLGFERQRKVEATGFARSLLRNEGVRAWKTLGGPTALIDSGVVVGSLLQEHLSALQRNPRARGIHLIWDVLSLESWLRPRL